MALSLRAPQQSNVSTFSCDWRFASLPAAQQACETLAWCGGVVRDLGLVCEEAGRMANATHKLQPSSSLPKHPAPGEVWKKKKQSRDGLSAQAASCSHDECSNTLGCNQCTADGKCQGERSCSLHKYCQGRSECPQSQETRHRSGAGHHSSKEGHSKRERSDTDELKERESQASAMKSSPSPPSGSCIVGDTKGTYLDEDCVLILDFLEPGACGGNNPYRNNLGGLGPDAAPGSRLRYKGVGLLEGRLMDLVIFNTSVYVPPATHFNGCASSGSGPDAEPSRFAQIFLAAGSNVTLQFQLRAQDTDEVMAPEDWQLSFFNLDGQGHWRKTIAVYAAAPPGTLGTRASRSH